MKNTIKAFKAMRSIAISALVAVIGFAMAGCASMTLVSVDTVEGPSQVRQGQDIDPASITVWGNYKDGSRKVARVNAGNITFNKNAVGPQTVTVRVSSQSGSFQTEVMALVSVSVASPPTATILKQGQNAGGWPGLAVQGEWDQMGTQSIPTASLNITGYNANQTGRQTITVSYMGKTTSFAVSIVPMSAIRVVQAPTKVDYLQGESLDLAGLRVVGVWEGLPEETLGIAAGDVTGFNANNGGVQHLTITKSGITTTFDVDVWRLTGIVLDRPPAKTDYVMGEQLVLTGIVVNANYAGSTAAKRKTQAVTVTQQMISGYNPNTIGNQQRITVTVGGQVANFFVNVALPPANAEPAQTVTPPAQQQPSQPILTQQFGLDQRFVGTWIVNQESSSIIRTFILKADGTGTYILYRQDPRSLIWRSSGNGFYWGTDESNLSHQATFRDNTLYVNSATVFTRQ